MSTQVLSEPECSTTSPDSPFILLVDDHELSLMALGAILREEGFACRTSASATEALSVCDSETPALVVTDLSMPQLDGHGLARWLRARFPLLPILLMTAETLDDPTRLRLLSVFNEIFTKPLPLADFLGSVHELVPPPSRP